MTTPTQRPVKYGPIYLAIEKFVPDTKPYQPGDILESLNTKPVWAGYYPEEVGYRYNDLCEYATRNSGVCNGGMRIAEDGIVTVYSQEQLENDYDPTEV